VSLSLVTAPTARKAALFSHRCLCVFLFSDSPQEYVKPATDKAKAGDDSDDGAGDSTDEHGLPRKVFEKPSVTAEARAVTDERYFMTPLEAHEHLVHVHVCVCVHI
jgi:hypothetical protein